MPDKARIAIMIGPKGRGSNMAAIAQACADGRLDAEVVTVIAPTRVAPAVEVAELKGLRVDEVAPTETYGADLLTALSSVRAEWICLAGYLRLLPVEVLAAYPRRVLNIHPALLPKFGGKGMYGRRVHEAVISSAESETGCTVHFVSDAYDEGEVIVQRRVPVHPFDTPEEVAARVLEQEHLAYVEALQKVLHA